MLGSAFLPFRDSCHHLQRQEISSDYLHHLHHLASPKWIKMDFVKEHSESSELIQPGGTPNLPAEVLRAPQCAQPRICLCQGVHRRRAVSIFCGNLVELYTRDDKRRGGKKEFQAMKSSMFFLFLPFFMISLRNWRWF